MKAGPIVFCMSPMLTSAHREVLQIPVRGQAAGHGFQGSVERCIKPLPFDCTELFKLSQVISLKGTLGLQLCCKAVGSTLTYDFFFPSETDRIIFHVWRRDRKTCLASQNA